MLVDFFFGPGSRYSYLAASQLGRIAGETGAEFRWRAVLSSDLTARTGGVPRSPQDPAWRSTDVERWACHYRVPFRDVTASVDWRRLALACAAAEVMGSAEAFARALYARTYGEGRPPDDDRALAEVAAGAGLSAPEFLMALESPASSETYSRNLEAALAARAFGVPSFLTADGALFWGQDRLPLLVDHLKAAADAG
ncbi:MAG: DsbA family protein [Phenylobacterium sp.]